MPPVLQRCLTAGALVALGLVPILDGAAVPRRFQLRIPGEGSAALTGDKIALTQEKVSRLAIEILNPTAKEIKTDRIYPRINGEAASTISEVRRTPRGIAVVLDLEMKPHLKLDAGDNIVEIAAENYRGRRFYQNWIVKVPQHGTWFTLERIDGPGESNPAHPEIKLLRPAEQPEVERGAAEINVSVEANVQAILPLATVAVDGVTEEVDDGREASIDRRLTIPGSRREVVLSATDVRGNETRLRIPIRQAPSAPPPRLSGQQYLLAIGISEHQSTPSGLPFLSGASIAAANLARLMGDRFGLEQQNILVLRDREATLAGVRSALRDFVSLPGPNDLLVVYLAAYGFHGRGPEIDRTYLACWDTRLDQFSETALSLDELAQLIGDPERVRSRSVLLLIEPRTVPGLGHLLGSNLVNAHLLRLFSEEKGRTVLVSADVSQDSRSRQTKDGLQGDFATAVMEGLRGEADGNRDRILTAKELSRFVSERVSAESDGAQVPRYRIADQTRALAPVAGQ